MITNKGGYIMKKNLKSSICIILSAVFICFSTSPIISLANEVNVVSISDTGAVVSVEDLNNLLNPSYNILGDNLAQISPNSVEIETTQLIISDDNITIDAFVSYNNQTFPLKAEGILYNGYKTEKGLNSIVADMNDVSGNFEILLFEIFNDTADNNLLIDPTLNTSPHIKIYLLDNNRNVVLIETELPEQLQELKLDTDEVCDSNKDMFWFFGLVEPTSTEIPTTKAMLNTIGLSIPNYTTSEIASYESLNTLFNLPIVQPLAIDYQETWVNPTTYYSTFNIGSEKYNIWSVPYVTYKHSNVSNSGKWLASFNVSEHVNINGTVFRGHINPFRYRNVQISFASGANTRIIETRQQGTLVSLNNSNIFISEGSKIKVKLLKKVVSAIPYGPQLQEVLAFLSSMTSSDNEVRLGSSSATLYPNIVTAAGTMLSGHELYKCTDYDSEIGIGHYFAMFADLQYESTSLTSVDTVGVIQVSFDVYDAGALTTRPRITKSIPLYYLASPSN